MLISKLKLSALIIFLLLAIINMIFITKKRHTINSQAFIEVPTTPTSSSTTIFSGEVEKDSMDSPDGTKTLIIERQEKKESTKYSIFISDPYQTPREIYSKDLSLVDTPAIPFNTWSPDNKYFFLKEFSANQSDYYVFFATGEFFSNNVQYLDIKELFEEKISKYFITDVTGWAAPTLLIINTKEIDGEQKVSFWFDVTSQSFTQLGTYFH